MSFRRLIALYLLLGACFAVAMLQTSIPVYWKGLIFMGALFSHNMILLQFRQSLRGRGTTLQLISLLLNGGGLLLILLSGLLVLLFKLEFMNSGNYPFWVIFCLLLYGVVSLIDFLDKLRRPLQQDEF
ncbi:MAG TPA: hypothetical protein VH186_05900 [Chloroflexia bacterium]|nr:hypothetical protein [Chloroflexia bacterium]